MQAIDLHTHRAVLPFFIRQLSLTCACSIPKQSIVYEQVIKMKKWNSTRLPFYVLASSLALSGCLENKDSNNLSSSDTGTLTIAITDSPIDEASAVFLQINGLTLYDANGKQSEITFEEPKLIDVLALQGGLSETILSDYPVKAGDYAYVTFDLDLNASYVVTADGNIGLTISNQRGAISTLIDFFVNDASASAPIARFSIGEGANTNITFDFDLRKSIFQEQGSSLLSFSPAIRSVLTAQAGSISGTIDANQFNSLCVAADSAVYAFSGQNATPRDIRGTTNDPISTANIIQTQSGYAYTLAFLPVGDYTISLACNVTNDAVDTTDTLNFKSRTNVSVNTGQVSTFNF